MARISLINLMAAERALQIYFSYVENPGIPSQACKALSFNPFEKRQPTGA